MFDNKKDADSYDKMLELAESISAFLGQRIDGLSEDDAENIGLLLSKNKALLIAACKGNPDALLDVAADEQQDAANVTPLTAKS
jgi:dsDNA-binding SOS-regulon protein